MKLFKSLLVAPATLGLLAPMAVTANEVTINDFNAAEEIAVTNSRIDGLEARFNNLEAGSFSETTTASFGADFLLGAVDGSTTSEAAQFSYQMGIDLETSFTGEDSLAANIIIGNGTTVAASELDFEATSDALQLDGLSYTFPLGSSTVLVGDNTDISTVYTGACAYNAFTDLLGNCGTGNSGGVEGSGVTAAASYDFDGGFSLAGGISSNPTSILTDDTGATDIYGIEAAYTADSYGVAVAYSDNESSTFWGVNGMYAFDFATLSVGYESEDPSASSNTKNGFFVGLSFPEVGAGTFDLGLGTQKNYTSSETELYTYEASYSYPINDGMTITPGVYLKEGGTAADETGFAVKTSFSF